MARLLIELDERGVGHALIESRGSADDRRDRTVHDGLRRARSLVGPLHISHAPGPSDPGLWIADIVCGAYAASRNGDPEFFEVVTARATVIDVEV